MKRNCFNRTDSLFFIECAAVFIFLLLPPLFSTISLTIPPKPIGYYAQCTFCLNTICAAAYEEVLYRLYTPNRLHRIYTDYIEPRLRKKPSTPEGSAYQPFSFFSHICREEHTAVFFKLCFAEFPALLLFTLAHRYLGGSSMLFAAAAGIIFRIAYLKLTCVLHPAVSIALVAIVHGTWNIGVYYYLWR